MLKLLKQGGGAYLIGAFTNRFQDRERQTITDAAHRDFEAYLNANPAQSPQLFQRHMPTLAFKSRATWWGYSGSAMVMVWPLEKSEVKIIEDMQNGHGELGMSHGFNNVELGIDPATGNELITKYRSFEASILPLKRAANYFTEVKIIEEQDTMFNQDQIDMMTKTVADAVGQSLMAMGKQLDNEAEALEQSGVFTKEASEEPEPVEATESEATEPSTEIVELQGVVEALVERLEQQSAQIAELETSQAKMRKQLGDAKAEKKAQAKPSWANKIAFRLGGNLNGNGVNGAIPVEESDPILKSKPVTADAEFTISSLRQFGGGK